MLENVKKIPIKSRLRIFLESLIGIKYKPYKPDLVDIYRRCHYNEHFYYIISESVKAISKGTYKHWGKHINPFGDKMEEPELLILNAMHKRYLSILENQRRKEHIRNVSKPLSYE